MDDEPEGGDAACWAHLFPEVFAPVEDAGSDSVPIDLAALAGDAAGQGPVWTRESADLDVNLLVFPRGEGIEEHVNEEVDVLLVGIAGEGVVAIDGIVSSLRAGHAVIVRKGARRGTRGVSDRFAYLSCHRRRGGLWPRV